MRDYTGTTGKWAGSVGSRPMEMPLLSTKMTIPPLRVGAVSRPRLLDRLENGIRAGSRLSLVSAPAGFGKTTLLAEWAHGCDADQAPFGRRRVAWVSLDEGDNDPARFLAYTVAALQTVAGEADQTVLALEATGLAAMEVMLTAVINALATVQPGVALVFDDYHVIDTQEIHEAVSFLLDHLPEQHHLVIATRADPPVPLARLRGLGRLTELRYEELRFLPQEVTAFLNGMMKLGLTPEAMQALDARTEGWVAGLQLAALSLRGRRDVDDMIAAFSSSHHYILEYLTEEALSRLPEARHRFLLQTSVLNRLCGSLCEAVTGVGDGGAILDSLHRDNLFLVPLDDEHKWYRYHPLFSDLMLKRLKKGTPPAAVAQLSERASQWHEDHGTVDEAITYALQAQDFERVLRLAEEAASAGLMESRLSTMLRWLEAVPADLLLMHPRLRIYQAWSLVINEQVDLAAQVLRECADAIASTPPREGTDRARKRLMALMAVVETMASLLAAAYSGENLDQVFQESLEAREQALASGNEFLAAHITNGLAMTRFHQGRLTQAVAYYHELINLGQQGSGSQLPLAAVGHIGLAAVRLERDELDKSGEHLEKGMRLGRHRVGANTLVSAAVTGSRLRAYAGDIRGAQAVLDDAHKMRRVRQSGSAVHRLVRQRLWLHLATGELDTADRLCAQLTAGASADLAGRTQPPALREAVEIERARLRLRQGKPEQALTLLTELQETVEAGGRFGRSIEIHLLRALALHLLGREAEALVAMESSLRLAEPEGYVRVYLDEGQTAHTLLRACTDPVARSGRVCSRIIRFARSLLEAYDSRAPGVDMGTAVGRAAPIEPLTPRERQVLKLLATGMSAPRIAEELVVAPSTVRSHLKSVYGKLAVHSRSEAIEQARSLRLV